MIDMVLNIAGVPLKKVELDAPARQYEDGEGPPLSELMLRADPTQFEEARRAELQRIVRRALMTLTPRERAIIHIRFGIGDREEATLDAAGLPFGICRERARQIQRIALAKLKKALEGRV